MDEDLRHAERAGDDARAQRMRERALGVPYKVWEPDEEGRAWLEAPGFGNHDSLQDVGEALLTSESREAQRGDFWLIAWSFDSGYLAGSRYAKDLPEPLEVLLEDTDLYAQGELDDRPTLHGGEPEFDVDDAYDDIHE